MKLIKPKQSTVYLVMRNCIEHPAYSAEKHAQTIDKNYSSVRNILLVLEELGQLQKVAVNGRKFQWLMTEKGKKSFENLEALHQAWGGTIE